MKIVIITRGRVGRVFTLRSIPKKWLGDTIIICPEGEGHAHPNIIREPYVMNRSQKVQWILDGADGQLPNKVIMMDDDLRFSARVPGSTTLGIASEDEISAGIETMFQLLDQYPLVGLHPRAMGNTAPPGVLVNKRVNALQAFNRELIGPVKVDHFPILADMFLNLTLLTRGQENAIWCDLFWDQVGTSQASGGCSIYRTWEMQRDAAHGLKAMFPDFVTIKEKVVKKGWFGDKPRIDFVVQWKKAAEYGKRHASK